MSEHAQSDEERAVDAHNRRDAWQTVATRLTIAHEEIANAQGELEGYPLDRSDFAEQLQPLYDALRRAANDAAEEATRSSS